MSSHRNNYIKAVLYSAYASFGALVKRHTLVHFAPLENQSKKQKQYSSCYDECSP
jgi:hypothetical protein